MIRIKLIILSLLLFISVSLYSQTQKIVIKLKQNTSEIVLNDFAQNSIKKSQNPLSKIIERYDIFNSEQLFKKFIPKLKLKNINLSGIDRIFVLQSNTKNINECLNSLKKNAFVEYAKTIDTLKLDS